MPEATAADCASPRPVPVIMVKGTADPVVPYAGGLVDNRLQVWPTPRLVGFFRERNGCTGPAVQLALPPRDGHDVEVELSSACSGGTVELYRIVGGMHALPANAGSLLLDFMADKAR
jgi:polyhydroxybutyrate depolymerase